MGAFSSTRMRSAAANRLSTSILVRRCSHPLPQRGTPTGPRAVPGAEFGQEEGMRVRWLLAFTLTASLAAGGGALGAAPASANWGSGFRQPSTCLGEAGMVGPHVLEGQWGGTMRLRGGAQVGGSQLPRADHQ